MNIPQKIQTAISENQFHFWYQPKVSFLTGKICGCEALIRWHLPNGDVWAPGQFLPAAEEAGLMTEIAQHMFKELCNDIPLITKNHPDMEVSFNLTAQDIEHPGMIGQIQTAIQNQIIQPQHLQVELTETAIPNNQDDLLRSISILQDLGVQLAMDDFGTGYSSLDALHRLPFDVVKIDQSVVMGLPTSVRCAVIVNASIRLAYEMGLTVVAEGVESEAVFEHLLNSGCTQAQGYWISKPLPMEKFLAFLDAKHTWTTFPFGLFRHAEIDHFQWRKVVLECALRNDWQVFESDAVLTNTTSQDCRFGQWVKKHRLEFKDNARMQRLIAVHESVHQEAMSLLNLAKNKRGSKELLRQSVQFNAESEKLLHQLQELVLQTMLRHSKRAA